jgi:selenide,water dikinase
VPSGSKANLDYYRDAITVADGLRPETAQVFADAQTNGGLLAAVEARRARGVARAVERAGKRAWIIGELVAGEPGIDVVP